MPPEVSAVLRNKTQPRKFIPVEEKSPKNAVQFVTCEANIVASYPTCDSPAALRPRLRISPPKKEERFPFRTG